MEHFREASWRCLQSIWKNCRVTGMILLSLVPHLVWFLTEEEIFFFFYVSLSCFHVNWLWPSFYLLASCKIVDEIWQCIPVCHVIDFRQLYVFISLCLRIYSINAMKSGISACLVCMDFLILVLLCLFLFYFYFYFFK